MGTFERPAAATSASPVLSLSKGATINLEKTASAIIVAENGWKKKRKDYDLKALVRYRDGTQFYIGATGHKEALATPDGAIVHSGDSVKAGVLERITIKWHKDIASVALFSYSAIKNGPGSFREYGVYVNILNGDQTVGIGADEGNTDRHSYTLCFGEIIFNDDQSFKATNLEMYSSGGSERRIGYQGDRVVMDIGPQNISK